MSRTLTLIEAAAELHKSKRWFQDWLAKHPVDAYGKPFYSKLGRTKIFREADIARILDATMSVPQCPSSLSRRASVKRRTIQSGGHTSESLWIEAQKLTGRTLRSNS
jgi:hypothetical protein